MNDTRLLSVEPEQATIALPASSNSTRAELVKAWLAEAVEEP
jgi:hypothetical protein